MRNGRPQVLVALALVGLAISAYLTAFQVGLIGHVWDPLFGDGSRRVLTSAISRALPIPDASVGAAGYAVDAVLAALLAARSPGAPLIAGALAVIALLGAAAGVALALVQATVVSAFCALCLCSTAISVALAAGAVLEARQWLGTDSDSRSRTEEATE